MTITDEQTGSLMIVQGVSQKRSRHNSSELWPVPHLIFGANTNKNLRSIYLRVVEKCCCLFL